MNLRPLFPSFLAATALSAQEPTKNLSPLVITATRSAQSVDTLPVTVDVFSAAKLHASPSLAVDDTLRGAAAFSLFRRSSSLTANPTAQGVSLRGIGPSGASRSLVLLDGVPLNDPFGGWVAWTKVPRLALSSAEIVRGGGSSAWGNASLGGSVQLLTTPPSENDTQLQAELGDFSTYRGELSVTRTTGTGSALRVDAAAFETSGVQLVRIPGTIDRAADSEHRRAQATWRIGLTDTTSLTVSARTYAEERGNGTPLQRNNSHENFASVALAGAPATGPSWTALAYAQDQSFESFFSSVNATRASETPANNQYDVPATAAGGAFTASWGSASDATTTVGTDLRWVEGETREEFTWNGSTFTRRRFAGGEQLFVGAFARHERAFAHGFRASLGARLDYWGNTGGFRREFNTATGAPTRTDRYADRDGVEFSPNLGLVWQATPLLRARAAGYQAFRVPTLNEYYRPFRVGAVSTEANEALSPETLTGGEAGLDFGNAHAGLRMTAFVSELSDAVANVTIATNTRQRRNLEHVRGRGIEVGSHWQLHRSLRVEADYLFSDSRVITAGPAATGLNDKRLAQVPRHTVTAGATWNAPGAVRITAQARHVTAQFEDDENALRLAPATMVDLALSRPFGEHVELFAAAENLSNEEVETGRTADGVVSVGPPRLARIGIKCRW